VKKVNFALDEHFLTPGSTNIVVY